MAKPFRALVISTSLLALGLSLGESLSRDNVEVQLRQKTWTFEPHLYVISSTSRMYEAFVDFDESFASSDDVIAGIHEARPSLQPLALVDKATTLQIVASWDYGDVPIMAVCSFSPIDQPGKCQASGASEMLEEISAADPKGNSWKFSTMLDSGDSFRRVFSYVEYDDKKRSREEWMPILMEVKRQLAQIPAVLDATELSVVAIWSGEGEPSRIECSFDTISSPGRCSEKPKRRITIP